MDFKDQQARFGQIMVGQPKKKKGRGGFLTSLISEGGGMGGAAAGASAGAALGSIVPGIGTVIGGLLGAGVGGGLGAFGGRLAENKVRDNEFRVKDAAKEGVISGVLSASPLKLLKGGASGAKAILGGSKFLPAAEKTITAPGVASKILGKISDSAAGKSLRLNPSQLTKFRNETGEDAIAFAKKSGLIGKSADKIKDAIPGFQAVYDQAIGSVTSPVTLQNILTTANKGDLGKLMRSASSDSRKVAKNTMDELGQALGRGKRTKFTAEDILNVKKDFDAATKNYKFDDSAKAVPQGISDLLKNVLREASPDAKVAGQNVSKIRKLSDLVGKQSDLGRGSQAVGLTDLLALGPGAGAGAIAGGPVGGVVGGAATLLGKRAMNSPKTQGAIANIAGGMAERGAARAAAPTALGSIARRQLPVRGAEAILGGLTQPDQVSTPDQQLVDFSQGSQYDQIPQFGRDSMADAGGILGGSQQPQSMYSRENAAMDIQRDLQATGGKNMDKYLQLYEFMNPEPSKDSQKPLSEAQQNRQDLMTSLGMAEDVMAGGSINYGPIGSRIEGIKSIFNAADPETMSYKNVIGQVRGAITKARAGASLTAGELKLLDTYTPKDTDSEQVVRSKLQQLNALYGGTEPVGGVNPQDILSQYGY